MKTVLVTGAGGFIGRHALPILGKAGYEVHAISAREEHACQDGIRWHRADLLDRDRAEAIVREIRPSHLLHFAWYVEPGRYLTSPENLRWLEATIGLARAFADHGGVRAVFAGTCFEYDSRFGYCSEDLTPCLPATLYAACKRSLMEVLDRFSIEAGFEAAWGRIFHLYGPHEARARLVPSVIVSLIRGERARCTHGRQLRDFLHAEDVAAAFVAILGSPITGPVNIGSGQPVSIRSIVERIADRLGRRDLLDFGAIEAPPADPLVLIPNVNKLRQEVGWTPRWPLDEGLANTVDWWRKQPGVLKN